MKKNLIVILLIFLIPAIAFAMLSKNEAPVVQVNNSQMPEMIKFTSSMCMDCQTMNKIIKDVFPAFEDKIVLTEIHVENKNSFNDGKIKEYNVTLVPTIVLLNSDGTQVQRIEGAISQDEMTKYLESLR
ncbi:MAG: thioredoxin family protein [Candidatus Gastranaerophilales bacterium]